MREDWDAYASRPIDAAGLAREPVQGMRLAVIRGRSVGRVLSVGAAEGYGNPPGTIALDVSLVRCERARDDGHVTVVADGCALPFADGSFDTVILAEVLEHVDNPGLLIAEATRVARERVITSYPLFGWADPTHKWRISMNYCEDPLEQDPTKGRQVVVTWQRGACWPPFYWQTDPTWAEQFGVPRGEHEEEGSVGEAGAVEAVELVGP
jgi:SAM-dependent methyltransferase